MGLAYHPAVIPKQHSVDVEVRHMKAIRLVDESQIVRIEIEKRAQHWSLAGLINKKSCQTDRHLMRAKWGDQCFVHHVCIRECRRPRLLFSEAVESSARADSKAAAFQSRLDVMKIRVECFFGRPEDGQAMCIVIVRKFLQSNMLGWSN